MRSFKVLKILLFVSTLCFSQESQCEFEKAFNLIGIDEPKAIELFSQCTLSSSPQKEESKIYLAYLYLNQKQPDIAKAHALAKQYTHHLYDTYCKSESYHNFCQAYSTLPKSIEKVADIFPILYFGGRDFAYGMIPSHPDILEYTEGYYGSSRDLSLGGFAGEYPKPFRKISIEKILSAKNSYKLTELFQPLNHTQGSIHFSTTRDKTYAGLGLDFYPERFFAENKNQKTFKDISSGERPNVWFFGWFDVIIQENPDLLQAYNECIQETQEYYQTALKLPSTQARFYAKKAVETLLLDALI